MVVHETLGHNEPEIEQVFFLEIGGHSDQLFFRRQRFSDPRGRSHWTFASSNCGISEISLANGARKGKVIYQNPDVRDYYRNNLSAPPATRQALFLKGRWFSPGA
jgi:hypothetical protein